MTLGAYTTYMESQKITVRLKILGAPPSGKNQRQLTYDPETGNPRIIKSYKALLWKQSTLKQITGASKRLFPDKTPLRLSAKIYYANLRPDLDDTLLCDVLQDAEVIPNDRYIFEKHYYRMTDKSNPRIELIIEVM